MRDSIGKQKQITRLFYKSIDAIKINDITDKSHRRALYNRLVGQFAEEVTNFYTNAQDLNEFKGNMPWADSITEDGYFQQVKSHIVGKEHNALNNYVQDFKSMIGLKDTKKLYKFIEEIEKNPNLKNKLQSVGINTEQSKEELRATLLDRIVMRVPPEHVEKVREHIRQSIERDYESWGYSEPPSEDDIDTLTSKVRSFTDGKVHISNTAFRRAAKDAYQARITMERNTGMNPREALKVVQENHKNNARFIDYLGVSENDSQKAGHSEGESQEAELGEEAASSVPEGEDYDYGYGYGY